MADFDDPMVLCSDCAYRARGMTARRPFDGIDTCEWCGEELEGSKTVVERQENPGPMSWQQDRNELFEWIQEQENTSSADLYDRSIDFTVGEMEIWPDRWDDDHLNVIRPSSISLTLALQEENPFDDIKIHLPPAEEKLREEIKEHADLPQQFGIHYGTGALGGMPAPEGVITPHVISGGDASLDELKRVVETVLQIYQDVYDNGSKAIQEKL